MSLLVIASQYCSHREHFWLFTTWISQVCRSGSKGGRNPWIPHLLQFPFKPYHQCHIHLARQRWHHHIYARSGGWLPSLKDPNDKLQCVAEQLFKGIDFMHSHSVAHLDIKPGNILVPHHGGRLSIIDYNRAVWITNGQGSFCGIVGTWLQKLRPGLDYGMPSVRICGQLGKHWKSYACGATALLQAMKLCLPFLDDWWTLNWLIAQRCLKCSCGCLNLKTPTYISKTALFMSKVLAGHILSNPASTLKPGM